MVGTPRSRFWDLGKQELKMQDHPVKDLAPLYSPRSLDHCQSARSSA